MVNFGLLAAEIDSGVLDTPANFNGFSVSTALLHGTSSGRQPNFAALNRGRHLYSAPAITVGIDPHSSTCMLFWELQLLAGFRGLFGTV